MRKMINTTHVEGYLYDHKLEVRTTGQNSKNPGTEYIRGTIDIATDDDILNIVPVNFTYVTATYGSGNPNPNYTMLKNIADGITPTVMGAGADKAAKLRVDGAIGLNEFYSDRNGQPELVSVMRNEGSFVHACPQFSNNRNEWKCDVVITNINHIDADDERGIPEKVAVKGCVFDFRKNLLPVEFSISNKIGMNYFDSLNASPTTPVVTQVWGPQLSTTIVHKTEIETAFGGPEVRETTSTRKEFVIAQAIGHPYEWDTEESITAEELKKAMADREVTLASIKQRFDDSRANSSSAPASASSDMAFNF